MLGRLAGFILLLLCFYVFYLGSLWDSHMMTLLGIALGVASAVLIVISRMKQNLVLLESYKTQLRELSKKPDDPILMEKAYRAGMEYYKSKRDNRKLLPMDEYAIQRDIASAANRKKA
ncbi:hypothetical protein [Thermotalea metallivorans]|uniref:Uncharacterized protein n=1 Tax=Thermotalea metallivorans TaxID=520762 RepID=A0A140L1G2_9FIRM|nr:hypothetical protein [Thermotalea metallivorans]KXG74387.1 hypothetical protein AN619_23700 [Thermotalea metallivorans]